MLQSIPMRIAGANILRPAASRRTDGSVVLERRRPVDHWIAELPHKDLITADLAFTSEPSFTRCSNERRVRCLYGELYVCIVDVRNDSPTFGNWQSVCLVEGDARTLTVPSGVACGWQILSHSATLEVRSSREVADRRIQWLRWDDRDLVIEWPERPRQLAAHQRSSRHLRSIPDRRLPSLVSTGAVMNASRRKKNNPPSRSATLGQSGRRQSSMPSTSCDRRNAQLATAANPTVIRSEVPRLDVRCREAPRRELILVVGSSGQLGRDLCRELRSVGTVVGACRAPEKGSLLPVPVFVDISRPASLRQAIRQVRPTLIVNAAGLTDIDQAESQPRLAQLVNATAPAVMADEAQRIGAGLVHFCSGMVFGGSGDRPWRETDCPSPQNQYARTKLIGTEAIRQHDVAHMVLRCGWLYSTHGDNYVRRLIDSLAYRNLITLADDHMGNPTSTNFLARLTADLLGRAATQSAAEQASGIAPWLANNGGLYHASTLGSASKLEVGDQTLAICRGHALPIVLRKLQGRPLSELPSLAKIPANCALDPTRLAMKFQLELPRWQDDLAQQIDLMLGAHSLTLRSVA